MDARQIRRKPRPGEDDIARPDRLESIAMRRIVVEMGYWLSPMLKDHPLPVLSEWERTVDLTALHNRPAWQPTKMEQSMSMLERLDAHLPRKTVPAPLLPNQVGSTNSRHDHNANRRALMSWERMTDAEREAFEARKEERRKQDVLDRQARMRETEAELREVLTEEEQATRQAKREKVMAAVRAEREREAAQAEAEAERRRQRAEKERQRKRDSRALNRSLNTKPELTEEEKAEHKAKMARERKRSQRARIKASKPVVEKVVPKVVEKVRPAVDLSHGSGISPLELARQVPLHDLMTRYLDRKMAIARNRAARSGKTIDEAATYAVEVERLDGHINKNPDFLYDDRARAIAHDRANTIVERELRRGSILPEEAAAYRLQLSPFRQRKEQLSTMTEAERDAERLAKKRARRAAAKGKA